MKEAGDGIGQQAAAASADPDLDAGKINKDMKGLVYQGGPGSGDTAPPEPSYTGEEPAPADDLKEKEKGPALSAESDTILNFTEKDSRLKAIALFIVVIVVIAIVAYVVIHYKGLKGSITISTTTTTIKSSNTPTTTILHNLNKTAIENIDVLYNYTGPSSFNGQNCGQSKFSTVEGYTNRLNASATFYIYDTESSKRCPLSINKIVATTPGFTILSISPAPPQNIPPNSSIYLLIKIRAPPYNYTGPLSLSVNEN